MKRTMIVLAIAAIASQAMATGAFHAAFVAKYKPGAKITAAGCALCHTSKKGGALNGYGKDLKAAAKGGKATAATFTAVEGKDSNGDGVKNGESIKKDVLP